MAIIFHISRDDVRETKLGTRGVKSKDLSKRERRELTMHTNII